MKNSMLLGIFTILSLFQVKKLFSQQRFKLIAEGEFEGIMTKPAQNMDVLVIHGTGDKPSSYADQLMTYFYRELCGEKNNEDTIIFATEDKKVTVRRFSGKIKEDRQLTFYVLHWSPYTHDQKDTIKQIEEEKYVHRSRVSKKIKNKVLINELSDFVAFSSLELKGILKNAMDSTFRDIITKNAGKESSLSLISGSLGSSVYVEYITHLQHEIKKELLTAKTNLPLETASIKLLPPEQIQTLAVTQGILEYIEKTPTRFYMLTNQVYFLKDIIDQREGKLGFQGRPAFQVTAFRHTNDVLSFYLPKQVADSFFVFADVSLVNVYYKNFPCGNFIIKAHERPFELEKLYRAILYGSDRKKTKVKIE